MSVNDLATQVADELFWDPKVDSGAIAVTAHGGTVTLRGTVGSFRERREAKKAAERVYGVSEVEDDLQVRLMTDAKRADADLRGDVLKALSLDGFVPSTVDVAVDDGHVTLTGTAEWQYQREEAEFVAANILGVTEITDEIELTGPAPSAGDVKDDIERAFKRNAKVDAKAISVETSNGTVKLTGTVNSWAEHDEAIDAAWAAPGVRDVDDHIFVLY